MDIRQELLYKNPSNEATQSNDRVYRGIVQEVFFKDLSVTGERFWQTYCDVQLIGLTQPYLRKVPLALTKSNIRNGEDWVPEIGDNVLVQFISGRVCDPVITGFLFPYDPQDEGLQPAIGDAPLGKSRYRRRCNGTSETIDKNGNRTIYVSGNETVTVMGNGTLHVYGNDNITIDGTGTITVTGAVTINVPAGATINGNVTVNGALQTNGTITARDDIRDQNGAKSMRGMRAAYNSHVHTGINEGPPISVSKM